MKKPDVSRLLLAALIAAATSPAWPAGAEPDADLLGRAQGYPVGGPSNWYQTGYRVGSWSTIEKIGLPVRTVERGGPVRELPRVASPPALQYRYRNINYTLDEYLERRRITGLLVLKNGEIVAEHYRYARTPEARFLSFSMAKSVTSLLVGIAVDKGLIASLDDPAQKYAMVMADSPYGATTIRQLLRMSSGIGFSENYDGNDDISKLSRSMAGSGQRPAQLLKTFTDRINPPGEKFVYATAETEVLSRVLTGAAGGKTMSELTSEWLWKPLGAERDAVWKIAVDGQEQGGGGFAATLRDWGRLGMMLANDGKVGDQQIVPREYLLDATDVARQPSAFAPGRATPYLGYGYQFWLSPQKTRTFMLQGIHGQTVLVQPSSGIVVVQAAVYEKASGRQDSDPYVERSAMLLGVLRSLGGAIN